METEPHNPDPNPPSTTSLPLPEAHDILTAFNTFLTVCIHNILYYRSIYPPETFLSARSFNLAVHQSRHPKLCTWIRDAVDAVAAELAQGSVERIAVAIHAPPQPQPQPQQQPQQNGEQQTGSASKSTSQTTSSSGAKNPSNAQISSASLPPNAVLERWMFDVSRFPAWPGGLTAMRDFGSRQRGAQQPVAAAADEPPGGGDNNNSSDETNWADVNEQLRGVVQRIASAAEKLGPLPPGCAFTMAIDLKEDGQVPIGHPQPWIPSPGNLQMASKSRPSNGAEVGGAKTLPIRSAEAGPLFFECWLEEGKAKELLKPETSQQTSHSS